MQLWAVLFFINNCKLLIKNNTDKVASRWFFIYYSHGKLTAGTVVYNLSNVYKNLAALMATMLNARK